MFIIGKFELNKMESCKCNDDGVPSDTSNRRNRKRVSSRPQLKQSCSLSFASLLVLCAVVGLGGRHC